MATTDPTLITAPPTGLVTAVEGVVGRTPWQLFWLRFKQDKAALMGLGFIAVLVALAVCAPLIAKYLVHHGPNELNKTLVSDFGLPTQGPGRGYWFGADSVGRDVFIRVLYGARTSFIVAIVATAIALGIGITLGMIAGFFGGWPDMLISRFIDIMLSMPLLLFAIGLAGACSVTREGCLGGIAKPGLPLVIFIIALFSWTYIARIIRGQTLSVRQRQFIEASRSLGAGNGRIMTREILPNLVAPIIIFSTLIIPSNILFEAYLSFLGLGVPYTIPSWGGMLSDAARYYETAWWLMLFPGLFLVSTTLAFNMVGDGLRDALDPKTGR